jgi:phage I-like protein
MKDLSVALNAIALTNPSTDGEQLIELLPAGNDVIGRDGRKWSKPNPQMIVDSFAANAADLPIDVEHATEHKAPNGEPAPAVGWVKQLSVREDGALMGLVAWNATGKALLDDKAYRYVSPVFIFNKANNQIVKLTSVGLTNQPNLYLTALNHQQIPQEDAMSLKDIAKALGLPEDASTEAVLAATQKAVNSAHTPSLDKFVPRTDYAGMEQRALNAEQKLNQHLQAQTEAMITTAVDDAIAAGKIAPASKDYHLAACRAEGGLERFSVFVASAPVLTQTAINSQVPPAQGSTTQLTPEEKAICSQMGIAEDAFLKAKGV